MYQKPSTNQKQEQKEIKQSIDMNINQNKTKIKKNIQPYQNKKKIDFINIDIKEFASIDLYVDALSKNLQDQQQQYPSAIEKKVVKYFETTFIDQLNQKNVALLGVEQSEDLDIWEYFLRLIFYIILALTNHKNCLLNSKNMNYLLIYYQISDIMFNIDEKKILNNENLKIIQSHCYEDKKHLQWILNLFKNTVNQQMEAIFIYIEQFYESNLQKLIDLANHKLMDSKQKYFGCHLVEFYQLYDNLDLLKICKFSALQNETDIVLKLIGKQSHYDDKNKKISLQQDVLRYLIDEDLQKYSKTCDILTKSMETPLNMFPQLIELKIIRACNFYYSKIFCKNEEYIPLHRIEELFQGEKLCLTILCESLYKKGMIQQAVLIFIRQNLQANDFSLVQSYQQKIDYIGEYLAKKSEIKEYKQIQPNEYQNDFFGPISQPNQDYLSLPLEISFYYIEKDDQIEKLSKLLNEQYLTVDAEWRPIIHKWQKQQGPAILQLSGIYDTFIIDILQLSQCISLDNILVELFSHQNSIIVGFGFQNDLRMFERFYPKMKFYNYIPKFIDAQNFYQKIFNDNQSTSLTNVCEHLLKKKLCKNERLSNWEKRPLRSSQKHYAALDAYCLQLVIQKLEIYGIQNGIYLDDEILKIGDQL